MCRCLFSWLLLAGVLLCAGAVLAQKRPGIPAKTSTDSARVRVYDADHVGTRGRHYVTKINQD